jgi:hypothetical protein
MKKSLITAIAISLFLIIENQSYTKPAEPQVKGGFKNCSVTDYRYKSGKIDMKAGVKTYSSTFDDKGNQIELVTYEDNKLSQRIKVENKYNPKGLIIETVYFDAAGKPYTKFTYGYDEKTNMVYDTNYNNKGEVTQRGFYKYDGNNFLIEETHEVRIDSAEFVKGTTYYKNDKYGNKIEESAIHSSNASVEVNAEVNLETKESKNDIKTSESKGPIETVTYEYKYDDKHQIIRDVRNGIGGTKLIHEYKYDKFGNMIEQISFDDNNKPALKTVFEYSK